MMIPQTRPIAETTAMLLIGDGVLALLRPSEHCLVWRTGNGTWRSAIEWFAERPALVRACGIAEVGMGLWLANSQYRSVAAPSTRRELRQQHEPAGEGVEAVGVHSPAWRSGGRSSE